MSVLHFYKNVFTQLLEKCISFLLLKCVPVCLIILISAFITISHMKQIRKHYSLGSTTLWILDFHKQTPESSDWQSHPLYISVQNWSPPGLCVQLLLITLYNHDCNPRHCKQRWEFLLGGNHTSEAEVEQANSYRSLGIKTTENFSHHKSLNWIKRAQKKGLLLRKLWKATFQSQTLVSLYRGVNVGILTGISTNRHGSCMTQDPGHDPEHHRCPSIYYRIL